MVEVHASAAPFQALCGPPWMSSSSGSGPVRSGSRISQPCTTVPSEMVNSRSSRANSSTSARFAPCAVRTVSVPVARSTVTISPNDVAVASTTAAVATGDRQPGHDPVRAAEDRPRLAAVDVDRVQVRAAAVADAEQHGRAVVDQLRQRAGVARARRPSRCGRAARPGRSARRPAVERRRQRQPVEAGRPVTPWAADDEQRVAVGRPGDRAGDAVGETDQSGRLARSVDVEHVRAGAVVRSASGAVAAAKASRLPSGDQAGSPACQSPSVTCRHSPVATSRTCRWVRMVRSRPAPSAW